MTGEITEVNSHALEASRHLVEQEMEARWQLELRRWPSLQREEEFFATLDPSEPRDPEVIELKRAALDNTKVERYLNNFLFYIPPVTPEGQPSQIGYMRRQIPKKYPERLSQKPAESDRASELRQGQTLQQYYDTIDRSISEEHIDLTELGELGKKAEMEWADSRDKLKFNQTLLKVVIRLRAMGYSHGDLAA